VPEAGLLGQRQLSQVLTGFPPWSHQNRTARILGSRVTPADDGVQNHEAAPGQFAAVGVPSLAVILVAVDVNRPGAVVLTRQPANGWRRVFHWLGLVTFDTSTLQIGLDGRSKNDGADEKDQAKNQAEECFEGLRLSGGRAGIHVVLSHFLAGIWVEKNITPILKVLL
jgi:hypothetical protein